MRVSQEKAILAHLRKGKTLTPLEALNKFSCFRLGARIFELKQAGHAIRSRMVKKGQKWVAEYSM